MNEKNFVRESLMQIREIFLKLNDEEKNSVLFDLHFLKMEMEKIMERNIAEEGDENEFI